jgi:hypothetical protein
VVKGRLSPHSRCWGRGASIAAFLTGANISVECTRSHGGGYPRLPLP